LIMGSRKAAGQWRLDKRASCRFIHSRRASYPSFSHRLATIPEANVQPVHGP
jgi:hypothetical protein